MTSLRLKMVFFVTLLTSPATQAEEVANVYYLKWNTDHTERDIRPAIPLSSTQLDVHRAYQFTFDDTGEVASICYFAFNKPSNHSAFGAHCIRPSLSEGTVTLQYEDVNGNLVANNQGVHVIEYRGKAVTNDNGLYAGADEKRFFDADMKPINDSTGTHRYSFTRDNQGRRTSESRWNVRGDIVPEHNGFEQAYFDFDDNDYALYRAGYDLNGKAMQGPAGYHRAVFTFDQNGTFVNEEFRDLENRLVVFPRGGYARIEYHDIDALGNWHTVKLLDTKLKPLKESASVIKSEYDPLHRRTSLTYLNNDALPASNTRGVHKRVYDYSKDPEQAEITQFDLNGNAVK